ncbi:uncharacterized protein V1518DRAFT_409591 [Limtongia smithiae]|uniref:uncharacterized protein n=1 Tax=Limtongia smithiae TaxID=1125753 RepID=UPI0034CD5E96
MAGQGYESIVYLAREVLVYQIPPLRAAAGYRATDWDVTRPLWKGRLRVLERSDGGDTAPLNCELRLEDVNTGELFAMAPYNANGRGVEQVVDSSRFFVIRVVDGPRHAYLGMGFAERNEAFDFNIALQDFRRHSDPEAENNSKFGSGVPSSNAEMPQADYALKDGETITISLGGRKHSRPKTTNGASSNANATLPFLPPPPHRPRDNKSTIASHHDDDDDFGEFVS